MATPNQKPILTSGDPDFADLTTILLGILLAVAIAAALVAPL